MVELIDEPSINRHFRLISVNFKEAALDSPSFRASINHLDNQMLNISQWLPALLSSMGKVPKKVNELKTYLVSFIEHLAPGFVQEGIMDQEVTVPLLKQGLNVNTRLFNICMIFVNYDTAPLIVLVKKFNDLYNKYLGLKKEFDSLQSKYDQYLSVYMASPKVKHSTMAIEDALQLFNSRKAYLRASLDLVITLNEISGIIDIEFINLVSRAWRDKVQTDVTGGMLKAFEKESFTILRSKTWSDAYSNAMKSLHNDIISARNQVEKSSIELFEPSRNPDDYKSTLINNHTLRDIDEPAFEKHGYLLMKTWVTSSTKPIWVKRWVFIKSGLFGMLILSPSKTFVQETDKIGLMLMSTRYAAQEERRFCFEIKTVDQTITLQAESSIELKSWLKVFSNERQRIINLGEELQDYKIASARYPPLITEFASTVDTIIDRQLTNTKIINENGQIITSSTLSSRIKSNEKFFQQSLYNKIPSIKPPLVTSNTKTAILAYSIAACTALPNALTANTWGSVNWGLYYLQTAVDDKDASDLDMLFDEYQGDIANQKLEDVHINDKNEITNQRSRSFYPPEYPDSQISLDVEMRAIFESAIEPNEICILSFTCLWSPNSNQELCCRVFLTNNNLLFCNQAMGFTSLFKSKIGKIMSVNCTIGENFDYLTVNFFRDSIRVKIFIESGNLIKQKLELIINNRLKEKPESLNELIKGLKKIDKDFDSYDHSVQQVNHNRFMTKQETMNATNNIPSIVLNGVGKEYQQFTVDFTNETPLHTVHEYSIPAKAMFHVLFGDNSTIIQETIALEVLEIQKKPWSMSSEGKLIKSIISTARRSKAKDKQVLASFVIERMVENDYYNITYTRKWYTFYGTQFSVNARVVIQSLNSDTCKVRTYSSIEFASKKLANLCASVLFGKFQRDELLYRHQKLTEVCKLIGKDAPVARAIYLYGRLTQTTESVEEPLEAPYCRIGMRLGIYHLLITPIACWISIMFNIVGKGIKNSLRYLQQITAQRLLLFIIILLSFSNVFLLSRTTKSYWQIYKSNSLADKMFNSEPMMLQRAVYLKDLHDITGFTIRDYNVSAESKPLASFQNLSFVSNFENAIDWQQEYPDVSTREFALGLKKTFQEIGIKRHKLLVEFNLLNQMETEVAKSEWKNWLMSELQKCSLITDGIIDDIIHSADNITEDNVRQGMASLQHYCASCSAEFSKLDIV